MEPIELIYSVSEFVSIFNQTLEFAYPSVIISGELANFKVSKNRWIYFDLKDEESSVRFFGSVNQLPGPLEDGMLLEVKGVPRLHQLYGFSVNVQNIKPTGVGTINKAKELLKIKLEKEGLFELYRKRPLPYPPVNIGLITSIESAAYHDFIKIINARWRGLDITALDVFVQGQYAVEQIVSAINYFNQSSIPLDVLVIIRGGGSPEDLQAFSTEQVTRAVSASRIPTLVAIGHEVDISLAEMAADLSASTPSNAAELLVPDRKSVSLELNRVKEDLFLDIKKCVESAGKLLIQRKKILTDSIDSYTKNIGANLVSNKRLLEAFNPRQVLNRGYSLVRKQKSIIRSGSQLSVGDVLNIEIVDSDIQVVTKAITMKG